MTELVLFSVWPASTVVAYLSIGAVGHVRIWLHGTRATIARGALAGFTDVSELTVTYFSAARLTGSITTIFIEIAFETCFLIMGFRHGSVLK